MITSSRKYTNKLIEMIDDEMIDPYDVVIAALNYMSEAEVEDMMRANDFIIEEDEDG